MQVNTPPGTMNIKHVYKAVKLFYPAILEEIKPKLTPPVPVLKHLFILPNVLSKFCELVGVNEIDIVGINHSRELVQIKILFIAVAITLYDPQLLTGLHSDTMRPNLRRELSGLLQTDQTYISQKSSDIRFLLNPYRKLAAYDDFKAQVDKLTKVLEIEFA